MEELNTQVAELNVLYKLFQEKPNKQTSASVRKNLMKIKTTSHNLRKNILLSIKPAVADKKPDPVAPIEPVAPTEPVEQASVEPATKKVKRSKSSKKEKQKITKEKATTVKFN